MTTPVISFAPGAGNALVVDLDRLVESRLLVQANSGGGKSHAIRYLLEQTHGRIQHLVIDREGEFATLRERYAYLLVGRGGEVAPDVRTAKLLARKLLELALSAILDLSEMSLGHQREYVATFVAALNHLPRELWKDCLVVIDEAHLFAPEKGKGESQAREPIAMLLSTGRKRGYCAVLATQRLAKLDKDVAAECLNKLIGRTSSEDAKRAGEELAFDRAGARELRALEPGQFWAYGPAIGVDPQLVRTGTVATRPPKRGAQREAAPPTPAAIAALAGALADLPKQADDEASTLEQLRAENRELTRRIRQLERAQPAPVVDQAAVDREVERAVTAEAERHERYRKVIEGELIRVGRAIVPALEQLQEVQAGLSGVIAGIADNWVSPPAGGKRRDPPKWRQPGGDHAPGGPKPPTPRPAAPRAAAPAAVRDNGAIGSTPQKMLDALAMLEQLGVTEAERSTVAGWVGISSTTGTFRQYLSRLRTAGYVVDRGERLAITDAGRRAAAPARDLPDLDTLHETWMQKLGSTPAKMLRVLIDAYPDAISRAALGAHVGISHATGTFRQYLSRLRTPGLMRDVSDDEVAATELLFPEGLR